MTDLCPCGDVKAFTLSPNLSYPSAGDTEEPTVLLKRVGEVPRCL